MKPPVDDPSPGENDPDPACGKSPVLVVSQYQFPENKENMNMYQRVLHGADHAEIHLLVRRDAAVSHALAEKAVVHRAPVQQRSLFLLYVLWFCAQKRANGCHVILTEPSGLALAGRFASRFCGMKWVLDVWDRPRWRTGHHEEDSRLPLQDRLIFGAMHHADLFLLSVLPRAAKDINPPARKCVQLHNAIDLRLAAAQPPSFPGGNEPLELACGRSKFHGPMGLKVVVRAMEILQEREVHARLHLVGEIPDSERAIIARSVASGRIVVHGFVPCTRAEFFARMHVGLIPYMDYEDLRYIFPIKALEHLSQGNPVVASDLPGLGRMIRHEENGLLVKPGDAEGTADAITRLRANPPLFERCPCET